MASHDYSKNVATATRMIAKYGRDFTLYTVDPSSVDDPSMPWRGTATPPTSSGTVVGVVIEQDWEDIVDGLVQRGKKVAIVQFSDSVKDVIEKCQFLLDSLDSSRYSVSSASPLAPGGTIVFWQLKLRQ